MATEYLLAALSAFFITIALLLVWKKRTLLSAILLGFILFLSFLLYQKEFSYAALTRKMYQAFENHQFHNAVVFARQRMNYARTNFPETSVDYGQAVHDLAFTYKSYECLQEDAEGLFREALGIFEKNLGRDSQLVAQTYDNLAIVLGFLDRPKEAAESSEKSLKIYETIQGPEGYDVYINLTNLAGYYLMVKNCDKAEGIIARSAALSQKLFPEGHPFDIRRYQFQASLHQCRGNILDAITQINAALGVIEKTKNDPQRLQQDLLQSLAVWQLELQQYDAAEITLLRLQKLTEGFGRGYYIVENTRQMLKELYRKRSGLGEEALIDTEEDSAPYFLVCKDKDFAGGFWEELKFVVMREVEIARAIWSGFSKAASTVASSSSSAGVGHEDLRSIRELTKAGQYQQALEKHIWFHNESKSSRGMGGVRLSYALDAWMILAKKYPPALDALKKIRDEDKEILQSGKGEAENFQDLAAINESLGEEDDTYELFLFLDKTYPKQSEVYYIVAEDLLLERRNYELLAKYTGDPISKYRRLQSMRGIMLSASDDEQIQNVADQSFVDGVVKLIEILAATNRKDEARQIQKEALSYFESDKIRQALD